MPSPGLTCTGDTPGLSSGVLSSGCRPPAPARAGGCSLPPRPAPGESPVCFGGDVCPRLGAEGPEAERPPVAVPSPPETGQAPPRLPGPCLSPALPPHPGSGLPRPPLLLGCLSAGVPGGEPPARFGRRAGAGLAAKARCPAARRGPRALISPAGGRWVCSGPRTDGGGGGRSGVRGGLLRAGGRPRGGQGTSVLQGPEQGPSPLPPPAPPVPASREPQAGPPPSQPLASRRPASPSGWSGRQGTWSPWCSEARCWRWGPGRGGRGGEGLPPGPRGEVSPLSGPLWARLAPVLFN